MGVKEVEQSAQKAVSLGVWRLPLSWVRGYPGAMGRAWHQQPHDIDGSAAWVNGQGGRVSE